MHARRILAFAAVLACLILFFGLIVADFGTHASAFAATLPGGIFLLIRSSWLSFLISAVSTSLWLSSLTGLIVMACLVTLLAVYLFARGQRAGLSPEPARLT